MNYTVTVNNAGPDSATNVIVTDTLPAGVTFVSTTGCAEDPGGVPTCNLGTISNGGSKMYTVTVTVDGETLGTITNNVSVGSDAVDPSPGNNTAAEDTLVVSNLPPAAVSVSPNTGTGASQLFSYLFPDPNGYTDLRSPLVIVNGSLAADNSCYFSYNWSPDTLYLKNDTNTQWLGPVTPGQPGVIENSQCKIDAALSSASGSGNDLTINVWIEFKVPDMKTQWMYTNDLGGLDTGGWQQRGTWTVSGGLPPAPVSVSPNTGTGASQLFSYLFSDPNGYTDLQSPLVIVNGSLAADNSCYFSYNWSPDTLYLKNDTNTQWLGPVTPGQPGVIENSQCKIDAALSSASGSGNDLTINVWIEFKVPGMKTQWMYTNDLGGLDTGGWQQRGTWTVSGGLPPAAVSISPNTGTGASQLFSYLFSDPNGYTDLRSPLVIVNGSLAADNSCYFSYNWSPDTLYLKNDTNTQWLGPVTPGQPGVIENSQCKIDAALSSASGSGNDLTINVWIEFKVPGMKTQWMYTNDLGGLDTGGWQQRGTWTVSGGLPPAPVSVSPNTGTGASQLFSYLFSDPNGYTDLQSPLVIVNGSLAADNSCYFTYNWSPDTLYLKNDTNTQWLGPVTPGQPGVIENSQCKIDAALSSASGSGNELTINVRIGFKVPGMKTQWMYTNDLGGLDTGGWQQRGIWTATGGSVSKGRRY